LDNVRAVQRHGSSRGINQGGRLLAIAQDRPDGNDLPVRGAGGLKDSFLVYSSKRSQDFERPNLGGGHSLPRLKNRENCHEFMAR
jgi:hypothetical protein